MFQGRATQAGICVIAAAFSCLVSTYTAKAAHCDGASHMGCYEGVDQSGRSPGALYDAAAEGLREARTPAEHDPERQ